jgi:hypothetical protein
MQEDALAVVTCEEAYTSRDVWTCSGPILIAYSRTNMQNFQASQKDKNTWRNRIITRLGVMSFRYSRHEVTLHLDLPSHFIRDHNDADVIGEEIHTVIPRDSDSNLELAWQELGAIDGLWAVLKVGTKPVERSISCHLGVLEFIEKTLKQGLMQPVPHLSRYHLISFTPSWIPLMDLQVYLILRPQGLIMHKMIISHDSCARRRPFLL